LFGKKVNDVALMGGGMQIAISENSLSRRYVAPRYSFRSGSSCRGLSRWRTTTPN